MAVVLTAILVCGTATDARADASKPVVVSSIFPVFDVVGSVGGKRIHAVNLLPLTPFADLTSAQTERLASAQVAFVVADGSQVKVQQAASMRTQPTIGVFEESASYEWLEPPRMAQVLGRVTEALIELDPAGASAYKRRARLYGRGLAALDRKMSQTLASCEHKTLVTTVPGFGRLAERYGFRLIEVDDARLEEAIKTYRPPAIFRSTLPSLDEARRLQHVYGIRVAVLDPLTVHTDQARRGGATYRNTMELNLSALAQGLKCTRIGAKR